LKEEIRLVNAKEPIAHPPLQWVPFVYPSIQRGPFQLLEKK